MVLSFEQGFRFVALTMLAGLVLVLLLEPAKPGVEVGGAH
jgi:hypothetical protein